MRRMVEEGLEARLANAEANAEEIAAAERRQLVEIRGDANETSERRARVADIAEKN